jgi:hypothetical protein
MSSNREYLIRSYSQLLHHAGLKRIEVLRKHRARVVQERLHLANQELKLFDQLPSQKITSRVIYHAKLKGVGPVTYVYLRGALADLPGEGDFPTRKRKKNKEAIRAREKG